jgi:cell shape-determining protein MreC
MTYRLDREKRRTGKTTLAIIGGVFFVIVFFWPSIQPFVYKVSEPLSKRVFELVGGAHVVPEFVRVYFSSRSLLQEEQSKLKAQIESLENRTVEQDLRLRELSLLFENMASTSPKYNLPIVASSLAQDVTRVYATLILSKGFSEGVEVGNKVYLRGRQVVCVVKDVYARTSQCELFSGFGNKVEAVTASSSINLTLEGRGGHYIANIIRDTNVMVGERILLREDQSFVLGEVAEVFNNDQDTSWHLLIRGAYNPSASSLYYIDKSI